jgi:hypothetical protein
VKSGTWPKYAVLTVLSEKAMRPSFRCARMLCFLIVVLVLAGCSGGARVLPSSAAPGSSSQTHSAQNAKTSCRMPPHRSSTVASGLIMRSQAHMYRMVSEGVFRRVSIITNVEWSIINRQDDFQI